MVRQPLHTFFCNKPQKSVMFTKTPDLWLQVQHKAGGNEGERTYVRGKSSFEDGLVVFIVCNVLQALKCELNYKLRFF